MSTIAHGATWSHFYVPTLNDNEYQDILLTFPDDKLFATHSHPHFGNTIGRTTNRIANGRIADLNGKDYNLSINETVDGFQNSLHGGVKGWGKHDWDGPQSVIHGSWDEGIKNLEGGLEKMGVEYSHLSPDGDGGFPGAVMAWTYYYEGRGIHGEIVLEIEYKAKLVDDRIESTVIGMTNHAYFNLNGPVKGASTREEEWNLSSHTATLITSSYLVLDDSTPGIPAGKIDAHPLVPRQANTPFSLTGKDGKTRPIDDCFVLPEYADDQTTIPIDTRDQTLRTLATIRGEKSGIVLRVQSTEPAFQFYTGKHTDVKSYEGGKGYGNFSAFCLEPSRFVNAAGREEWRSQVLLKKGETFGARNRYWALKE